MSVTRSVCAECVQSAAFGGDRMMCRSAVAVSLTSPRTLLVAMLLSSSAVVSAQDQVSQSSADQMAAADATDPEQDAVARPSSEANQATSEAGAGAETAVTEEGGGGVREREGYDVE